jgi:HlyD family secretion protein
LILLAAAGCWVAYQQWDSRKREPLVIQGNVDIRQVNLGFRVGGRIREMRFEEGDAVRAGDLVAVLDEEPYRGSGQPRQSAIGPGCGESDKDD